MKNNNTDITNDPCRIIIIGLPFSGKDSVAKILSETYNCKLLDLKNVNPNLESHKGVSRLCFDDYDGRAEL